MFRDHFFDFGRNSKQEPKVVIFPTTIHEIKEIVKNTGTESLAIRGKGHCTGGQALALNGTVLDMRKYAAITGIIEEHDEYFIEVQAGALWKDVFNYCLHKNLMPPTYADWLDLTVGGTISTGGVGQCSFKKGLQIDHVVELEVVTGAGEVIRCDKERNSFLFNLVRGGLGQYGIISKVKMKLEPAPKAVAVHKLLYDNLRQYLLVQTMLTTSYKVDAIQSHIIANEKEELTRRLARALPEEIFNAFSNRPQLFIVEVTQYSLKSANNFKLFLNSNSDLKPKYMHSYEAIFEQHVNRVPPLLENPLEKNLPQHHHCCFFIAEQKVADVLEYVFSQKEHICAMGGGALLVIPLKRSLSKSPYFMLPKEENLFFIGILRRHLEPYAFESLIDINENTYRKVLECGGTIYPVGSGHFLGEPAFWEGHYGGSYSAIIAGKGQFDPGLKLSPNVIFFKKNNPKVAEDLMLSLEINKQFNNKSSSYIRAKL